MMWWGYSNLKWIYANEFVCEISYAQAAGIQKLALNILYWLIYIAGSGLGSLLGPGFLYYTNTMVKGSESGSEPMWKVSAQYYVAMGFGIRVRVWARIRVRQCKSVITKQRATCERTWRRQFNIIPPVRTVWTPFSKENTSPLPPRWTFPPRCTNTTVHPARLVTILWTRLIRQSMRVKPHWLIPSQ